MLKAALAMLFAGACALHAGAAGAAGKPVSAKAEVKLNHGANDVRLGTMRLRIIRAFLSNMTASSFDTYTVYLLPEKPGDPWLQVTLPSDKGIGYNLRSYESGDANVQAVSFYWEDGKLYAMLAARGGEDRADANLKKVAVEFRVFKFNENWDVPMFVPDAVTHSRARYNDASDALKQEFFMP
jgi:hypothetical protein